MKKLLAFLLVMVLALATMTACDPADTFGDVKDTVGGWFGKGDDTNDDQNNNDQNNNDTPDTPDTPAAENYAAKAINYLNVLYGGEANTLTGSNYELKSEYTVPGTDITLTITWTSSVESVTIAPSATAGYVLVTVPAAGDEDLNYTVTATVTDSNGNTETKTFDRVVPSVNNYMTPDEYYAASTGTTVIVKGIVTGIINKTNGQKYNQIYVNDESYAGGYYVYKIKEESIDDLKVGMTVKVTGVKDKTSYNEQRIKEAVIDILDETIKTVTPVDYTDIYKNAAALTDASLVYKAGMLVTLKGVEVTGQTLSNGYYHFKLGEKESYVRISSSTCCLYGDDLNTFKANHTNNTGNTADVVGVIATYDKAFYIVPVSVDAFSNFKTIERTDADKVQYELDALEVNTSIKSNNTLNLTVAGKTFQNVVITWASNNTCAVVSDDYKTVTFTLQDEAQTVVLTATASIGTTTATKTFTVKVAAKPNYVVNVVDNPVAGVAYKFYLYHTNLQKDMYMTGKMSGYYYATTGDVNQAVDVYLEETTGGFYFYGVVDGVKKYFNITSETKESNGEMKTYYNVTADFDAISVYTFDATLKTITTVVNNTTFLFGTGSNKTYDTISANQTQYASTTCIAYFVQVINLDDMSDADKVAAEMDKLTVDTTVNGDKEVTLPSASVMGVTVEWTVTDNATIADGKLVITQGAEAMTVVLTATVKSGDVTETKTFTFEVPAKVSTGNGIKVDLETITETSYSGDKATASGWTLVNGMANTKDMGFHVIVLNGKVGSVGVLTSPALTGGLTKITFNYANPFNENNGVDVTIQVIQNGTVVAEKQLDNDNVTKLTAYAFEWTLTTPVTGDYQIKIFNNSPSNYSGGNKDRAAFWDFYYYPASGDVVIPQVTDADKVKAESNAVKFDVTDVTSDTTVTLPVPQVYANDVTFTWTVEGDCATITDGKLVITLPVKDTTVTLTLVIVCGEAKDVKTYTINVVVPTYNIQKVTNPVADKAYKLYLVQANTKKELFFNGKPSGTDYLATTALASAAADVYLETTDGGYYVYFLNADGTKSYITMYEKTANKVRIKIESTPSCVFVVSETLGTIVAPITTTTSDGKVYNNSYYFGTYDTYNTISANSDYYVSGDKAADIGVKQFIAYLVEVNCKHEFSGDCDTTCDICGETRTTDVEHKVDDVCDKDCNVCGAAVTPTHKYTADCDTTCDCGATRTTEATHKVDDVCDKDCNVCGAEIVPTHKYLGECDATCEACGATRETTVDHKYLGECDATCEICGATRETTAGHTTKACDETNCSVCGAAVEPKAHVYDGCEDTQCNNCPAEREAGKHEYSSVCDSTCNNEGCNNVREAEACVDADKSGVCDNDGCGKEVGPDTPEVEVPVNNG